MTEFKRIKDLSLIPRLAGGDLLAITDTSDDVEDRKVTVSQLSDFFMVEASSEFPYPLYTITGYTATLPDDPTTGEEQVPVAEYATIAAFEAAVVPTYSGQRCQILGYPTLGAYNVLEARWNGNDAFEWGIV